MRWAFHRRSGGGALRPGSGQKSEPVDVRVAATTDRPLEDEVRLGRFRDDLCHRLRTVHLHLPPLRERTGDLVALLEHFLARHAPAHYTIDSRAMAALYAHPWPGNVRELEVTIERAVASLPAGGKEPRVITVGAFPPEVQRRPTLWPAPAGFVRRDEDRRTRMLRALAAHGGNRSAAARALGIGRATFYRWWGEAGLA